MPKFTDPRALSGHIRRRGEVIRRAVFAETEDTANEALRTAQRLTSGPYRQEQFNRMGHPFARRFNPASKGIGRRFFHAGVFPLLPINAQSGQLRRSFRKLRRPGRDKSEVVFIITNTAPHARFILSPTGTRYQVPRPFWKELTRLTRQYGQRHTIAAFRRASSARL